MHRSPSALYHTEFVASAANVAHLGFPKTLFVTENRVQGMSCGDWNVWWFPEWQWSPQRWYGAWPLPPYFHPGTELHVADADGNTLPSDYDPLNCTQHAELLARGVGGARRLTPSDRLRTASKCFLPLLCCVAARLASIRIPAIKTPSATPWPCPPPSAPQQAS